MEEEEGELVGTGELRIDVSGMLGKLAKSGYGKVRDAYLALVRCAALSGAKTVTVKGLGTAWNPLATARDGLELSFGGRAFDAETIDDPYKSLGGFGGPERTRTVLLARALLTLTNSGPYTLTVSGGAAARRVSAEVAAVGKHETSEAQAGSGTRVRVEWLADEESGGTRHTEGLESFFDRTCRHSALKIKLRSISGPGALKIFWWRGRLDREAGGGTKKGVFAGEGYRGALERSDKPAVDLYWAGARVETLEGTQAPAKARGFLELDAFQMDLSAQHVVRDESFERALSLIKRHAPR